LLSFFFFCECSQPLFSKVLRRASPCFFFWRKRAATFEGAKRPYARFLFFFRFLFFIEMLAFFLVGGVLFGRLLLLFVAVIVLLRVRAGAMLAGLCGLDELGRKKRSGRLKRNFWPLGSFKKNGLKTPFFKAKNCVLRRLKWASGMLVSPERCFFKGFLEPFKKNIVCGWHTSAARASESERISKRVREKMRANFGRGEDYF
jgi:hypothetical protein